MLRKIDMQILKILKGIPVEKSNPYYIAGVLGKSYNSIYQSFKVLIEIELIDKTSIDNKTCYKITEEGLKYIGEIRKHSQSDIDYIMEE